MVFYHGYVRDDNQSLVSLTISRNEISGFISDRYGNYSFQTDPTEKLKIKQASAAKGLAAWTCHTSDEDHSDDSNMPYGRNLKSSVSDTISIYFECDYSLFELHGFSTSATEAYVYQLFNQVQAIYDQEDITIVIEDIYVWDQPDPYDQHSVQQALLDFRDRLGTNYPGTFAHLLSGNPNVSGGLAFVNGLCNRDKSYGYSNLDIFIDPSGAYSWDVHVVAHELGHNFGSPHTHACAWGPSGDEAIDACGAPAPECENAPIPPQGGTIMSYCHTAPVGVNFSLGFGPEPGNLIRSMIGICQEEEGDVCHTAIPITKSGTYTTSLLERGSGANNPPATHAQWFAFTPPNDGRISIHSCGQGVDTRLFLYNGDCHNLNQLGNSDDDCLSGGGYNYASELIDIQVVRDETIYIEWDDRWSSNSFSFEFTFEPDPIPHCENGIQDMDETGIDCGGSCGPCPPPPCQNEPDLPEVIDTITYFSSMDIVAYNGSVSSTAMLDVASGQEVVLEPGFVVSGGGMLVVNIEECQDEH